ncbi:hypothetical protein BX600DRAFT_230727 [Xylariales sp. PMI_506]|nr:hypothetical protein BX600DRAFT_230727 [Xylariales sp. PMI_506]
MRSTWSILAVMGLVAPSVGFYQKYNYTGCYSSLGANFIDQGQFKFQSPGHCRQVCNAGNHSVYGLTNGWNCFCGDELPSLQSQVDENLCDRRCPGYYFLMCGSAETFSVWANLTVLEGPLAVSSPNSDVKDGMGELR